MSPSGWLFRCLACRQPFEDNGYPKDSDVAWCPHCDRVVHVEALIRIQENGVGACPRCGSDFGALNRRTLPGIIPPLDEGTRPGDTVVCFQCALPSIVGDDGRVRPLTHAEILDLATDKAFCNVLRTAMDGLYGTKLGSEPIR